MLVAIDGSETAAKAMDFALELAEKCVSEIEIVSVVPPVKSFIPQFPVATPPEDFYDFFIKHVENRLKTVLSETIKKAKEKKTGIKITTRLLKGNPAQTIVQAAEEGNFDMIVVGNRGLSGIAEFVLGSVSNRIADTAKCPVLIVK
jgi:nucleotide-binding universal stress UspA family protein